MRSAILFPVEIVFKEEWARRGFRSGQVNTHAEPHRTTILFISLSEAQINLEVDWATACAGIIPRRCPICECDSIVGHGRRNKQAHDEDHNRIMIRRGLCRLCKTPFTILPPFSLPYTHYSLFARSQALWNYFVEGRSLESSAPTVQHPDRVAAPSTLRRWFRSLDSSHPPFSFLRPKVRAVSQWLQNGETLHYGSLRLAAHTLFAFLQRYWPLRL